MTGRAGFVVVLSILIVAGIVVAAGEIERDVSLSSVLEVWGDVLRDADQFGFQLTRVSNEEEMRVGRELAGRVTRWWREDPERAKYVAAVGARLLPHVRRKGIRYEFHVVGSPRINAFALPGGQIYVMTGMLEFLQSEAELAAILGHEMAHVDLRHAIERFQYELALRRVGARELGQMAEVARRLLTIGYNKYQELEADAQGVRVSIEAGYEPEAAATVLFRLAQRFGERARPKPTTPVGEITQALEEAMGSYFESHPRSEERTRRLQHLVLKNRERLKGRVFYRGVENYREQVPRTQKEFPGEQGRL